MKLTLIATVATLLAATGSTVKGRVGTAGVALGLAIALVALYLSLTQGEGP